MALASVPANDADDHTTAAERPIADPGSPGNDYWAIESASGGTSGNGGGGGCSGASGGGPSYIRVPDAPSTLYKANGTYSRRM